MTISITERDWAEWEEEATHLLQHPDPEDQCDWLIPQPTWLAQGYRRLITLHDGLLLRIDDFQFRDGIEEKILEGEQRWVQFHCHLSGDHRNAYTEVGNLEYALYGSGIVPKQRSTCSGQFPILEVEVVMSPEALIHFAGNQGELPGVA